MTNSVLKKAFALILAVVLFCGCSKKYTGLDKPLTVENPLAPVTSNGGIALKQGEWIYYINGDNFTRHEGERFSSYAGALCRMKEDGSDKTVVLNKDVCVFDFYNGRFYLCIYEQGKSISASVKVDGTDYVEYKTIDDIFFGGCYGFLNGNIYYTKDFKLYRMNEEGKNSIKITDFPIYNLRLNSEYVFFTKDVNGDIGNIYKLKNSENDFVEITKEPAYVLDIIGDNAYYYMLSSGTVYCYDAKSGLAEAIIYGGYTDYLFNPQEDINVISYTIASEDENVGGIFTMKSTGGEKTKISSYSGKCMVLNKEYIYYINVDQLNQLYRVKIDGTNEECVSEEFVYDYISLDIVGEYLYFLSDSDYDRIYRINLSDLTQECVEFEDIAIVG
ncbi:MAG: DUF5050 domain-containing protein [Clostridiales bacterium]|nr:DUF5050 domain-containing protein [Clostridiales bacterium]